MLRHAFQSPKLAHLAQLLGLETWGAVGVLESLWFFTATQSPRGDVGRWGEEQIAAGIGWRGDAHELVGALVSSRWVDPCQTHRLLVHDWSEHSDQAVKRSHIIQQRGFAQNDHDHVSTCFSSLTSEPHAAHMRGTSAAHAIRSLYPEPEPEPVPEPEGGAAHRVEGKQPKRKRASPDPSPGAARLAERFTCYLANTHPEADIPSDLRRWAAEFDTVLRKGPTVAHIEQVIDWLESVNPGREAPFVVQSPRSFKEKYARICAQMKRREPQGGRSGRRTTRDAAESIRQRRAAQFARFEERDEGAGPPLHEASFTVSTGRLEGPGAGNRGVPAGNQGHSPALAVPRTTSPDPGPTASLFAQRGGDSSRSGEGH